MKNELIINRRKKQKIKKVFLLFLFLIAVLLVLSAKLPYFNINNIAVYGNKNIVSDKIISLSKIYKGNNVFYINIGASKKNILSDPYIDSVEIKRQLPSRINIIVTERNAVFYIKEGNYFYIVDKNGILLQKKDNIIGMNLVNLTGLSVANCKIGDSIKNSDGRKADGLKKIGNLISQDKAYFEIKSVDISNSLDMKAYRKNICIKLGNADGIQEKLNKALNIIEQEKLNGSKGYIDVRFGGNPVFFMDNK